MLADEPDYEGGTLNDHNQKFGPFFKSAIEDLKVWWDQHYPGIPLKPIETAEERYGKKLAGDLTNAFIYYNGKLAVDNVPHPRIIERHFPEIDYFDDKAMDMQAGLIYEENGKVYPVFHSYTLPSQEHKREALQALEQYYMMPMEEELDYSEAMDRLSAITPKAIYVDHPVTKQ
jgi:hypothetical protein